MFKMWSIRIQMFPPPSKMDIMGWLKKEYEESRGFELGTFDASLLGVTMKQQASDWRNLALGYISDIIVLVHNFVLQVLKHLTPNHRVFDGIKSRLIDDMIDRYQKAISHTEFLLSVELDGTPATYNHYFNETLEKWYVSVGVRTASTLIRYQSPRTSALTTRTMRYFTP